MPRNKTVGLAGQPRAGKKPSSRIALHLQMGVGTHLMGVTVLLLHEESPRATWQITYTKTLVIEIEGGGGMGGIY